MANLLKIKQIWKIINIKSKAIKNLLILLNLKLMLSRNLEYIKVKIRVTIYLKVV